MIFIKKLFKVLMFFVPIASSIVLTNDNFYVKPKLHKNIDTLKINVKKYKIKENYYQEELSSTQESNIRLKNNILNYKEEINTYQNNILHYKNKIKELKNKEITYLVKIEKLENFKPIIIPIDSLKISEEYMKKFNSGHIKVKKYNIK